MTCLVRLLLLLPQHLGVLMAWMSLASCGRLQRWVAGLVASRLQHLPVLAERARLWPEPRADFVQTQLLGWSLGPPSDLNLPCWTNDSLTIFACWLTLVQQDRLRSEGGTRLQPSRQGSVCGNLVSNRSGLYLHLCLSVFWTGCWLADQQCSAPVISSAMV